MADARNYAIIPVSYFLKREGSGSGFALWKDSTDLTEAVLRTAGIIAEFNPFHRGHACLMDTVRQQSGADYLVVIMSGDFVQRGAPALLDKYERTRMALLGGADLVLELPCAASAGSAQRFAESAVFLLSSLGAVDELWFGSEAGDIRPFLAAADILSDEPVEYQDLLRTFLKEGAAFPKARAYALRAYAETRSGSPGFSPELTDDFLSGSNNILGLEYVLALRKLHSRICPKTILRRGAGYHDSGLRSSLSECPAGQADNAEETVSGYPSAEAIRGFILREHSVPEESVPDAVLPVLENAVRENALLETDDFSDMLLYQLMKETADSLLLYEDVDRELAFRILNNRNAFCSVTQFASLLKTKNRTRTQIDRALLHILLNIRREDTAAALTPDYVRVLGFSRRASEGSCSLLRRIRTGSSVCLITKASDLEVCEYDTDLFASSLYEQVRARKTGSKRAVHEYERPVIIM